MSSVQEYRQAGRFAVKNSLGAELAVLVFEHWFENEGVRAGADRWQVSGIRRFRLVDGRSLKALSAFRFVIEDGGEELQRPFTTIEAPAPAP